MAAGLFTRTVPRPPRFLGFKVQGVGFGVQVLGFRVWDLGFRVAADPETLIPSRPFRTTFPRPLIRKSTPLNRDYNRDPYIQALKKRGWLLIMGLHYPQCDP